MPSHLITELCLIEQLDAYTFKLIININKLTNIFFILPTFFIILANLLIKVNKNNYLKSKSKKHFLT